MDATWMPLSDLPRQADQPPDRQRGTELFQAVRSRAGVASTASAAALEIDAKLKQFTVF